MKIRLSLVLLVVLLLTTVNGLAQEITFTTSAANTVASKATIEMPTLNGNPNAIIIATPIGNTATLNPHPIGVWYYNGKWNIFNTDHAMMPAGLKFKLQIFPQADFNHFLHIVTKVNLTGEGSEIDNPSLNNNPTAQVTILQNHAPDNRSGFSLNKFEAKAGYDSATGKWYIANVNGNSLNPNTAYNVVVTSGGTVSSNTSTIPATPTATPIIVTTPTSANLTTTESTSITLMTPEPFPTKNQIPKSYPLTFDNLNNFVEKGLPDSAPLPFGNIDHMAAIMAQQISKGDEKSVPMLLTALQVAGFTVIDENGKVLLQPADGIGQGLTIYDFEAVGAIKLAKSGQNMSLEKIAGIITKDTPEILGWKLTELMLQDLRLQADNSEDKFLRFWARLIIALGKASPQPVDLMTVTPSNANITMLQATLLIRRLQGDLYLLKTQTPPNGQIRDPFSTQNSFVSVNWQKDNLPIFQPFSSSVINQEPCNMTKDEAYILGGTSKLMTWGNKKFLGLVFEKGAGSAAYSKIAKNLRIANLGLSWLKLAASVTSLRGEITVEKPLPLKRTLNAEPGQRRWLKVRIWNEVGRLEMLNCVRKYLNTFGGVDFAMPIAGPLSHKSIEWHFAADNQIRVNNAETRNLEKKFVDFESPKGKDPNPQKQETNEDGEALMYLVGTPKIPAIVYQKKPIEIEKKANVVVGITLKSAKDVGQNVIDIGGILLSAPNPVSVLSGVLTETGYRLPYAVAFATIPVIDHEPCDGQWVGTVTYTEIRTFKGRKEKPPSSSEFQKTEGGYETTDSTLTLSGTIAVNSKFGHDSPITSSVDEIVILDEYSTGKVLCSRKRGYQPFSARSIQTGYGSGSSKETTTVYINLNKDNYKITITPPSVKATLTTTLTGSAPGNCAGSKGGSLTNSVPYEWGSGLTIIGKANYENNDKTVLSGSDTVTKDDGRGSKVVTTITWNLKQCNQ